LGISRALAVVLKFLRLRKWMKKEDGKSMILRLLILCRRVLALSIAGVALKSFTL